MRTVCLWIFLVSSPLLAIDLSEEWSLSRTINEEEALSLRRIADFWQEGEYTIAKSQMEEFLAEFPESQFIDPIRACLGDLLLKEKNYSGALTAYSSLTSSDLKGKTFLKRLQCLYYLEWYATLADECESFLEKIPRGETHLEATYYLAIALYHQCLNAAKHPEILLKLAHRAEPYFQTLLQSDLSIEAAQAFAHLCCILKEYQKAADMYLAFAQKAPDLEEEMLFQAALIQTEYDQNLALQSFEAIEKKGGNKAKEASYHHLVLSFETGNYEKIVQNREAILESLPNNRKKVAHLFFGRSFFALNRYPETIHECTLFLEEAHAAEPEIIRLGLLTLIEAARHSQDVEALDIALEKLSSIDPSGEHTARSRLLRAMLLKNLNRFDEAREEFKHLFLECPDFPDQIAARLEEIDLEYTSGSMNACRQKALSFLSKCSGSEEEAPTWRYLLAASSHLAAEQPRNKEMEERFRADLEAALQKKGLFPLSEENDWKFFLAQAHFNLGALQDAASILIPILKQEHVPFLQEANALLILGLCYLDSSRDLAAFCLLGEEALQKQQNIMDLGALHVALFNAYLERFSTEPNMMTKSAHHLYEAFLKKAEISLENLLWLGEWHFSRFEEDPVSESKEKASLLFSSLMEKTSDPHLLEIAHYRMGKLYSASHQSDLQIEEMEKNLTFYQKDPSFDWKWEEESRLLLAEGYLAKADLEKAEELLDAMIGDATVIHSKAMAQAFLERASLSFARLTRWITDDPTLMKIASELKTLILQKNLLFEPVHLEAALIYVDLLEKTTRDPAQKRLSLLEKIKSDFETEENILSKNYHLARLKYPSQNRIYENYIGFLDAEILMAKAKLIQDVTMQKELQAKAKHLLLQVKDATAQPTLLKRIQLRLQETHESITQ